MFHGFVSLPLFPASNHPPVAPLPADARRSLPLPPQAFIMDVSSMDGTLVISAEEKETGDRWRGQVSLPSFGCRSALFLSRLGL